MTNCYPNSIAMSLNLSLIIRKHALFAKLAAKIPMKTDVTQTNDPKFLEGKVWTNIADPDQTAPRGSVSSLFAIPSSSFRSITA